MYHPIQNWYIDVWEHTLTGCMCAMVCKAHRHPNIATGRINDWSTVVGIPSNQVMISFQRNQPSRVNKKGRHLHRRSTGSWRPWPTGKAHPIIPSIPDLEHLLRSFLLPRGFQDCQGIGKMIRRGPFLELTAASKLILSCGDDRKRGSRMGIGNPNMAINHHVNPCYNPCSSMFHRNCQNLGNPSLWQTSAVPGTIFHFEIAGITVWLETEAAYVDDKNQFLCARIKSIVATGPYLDTSTPAWLY